MMMMVCDGGVRHGGCGDGRVELGFVSWCGVSRSLQPLYTIKNKLVLKIRKKDSPNIRLGPFYFCCCSLCCCCIGGGDGRCENGVNAKSKPSESARGRHKV